MKPLITVLDEDGNGVQEELDDMPPPLMMGSGNKVSSSLNDDIQSAMAMNNKTRDEQVTQSIPAETGPSLMQQLIKEASEAKVIEDEIMREKQRKESQAAFQSKSGSGFKKGFLKTKKSSGHKKKIRDSEKCYEKELVNVLESDIGEADDTIIDVRHLKASTSKQNSLHINEVQEAMEQDQFSKEPKILCTPSTALSSKIESLRIDGEQDTIQSNPLLMLGSGEWATPELMDKVARNPRLQRFITDPRYVSLLESLNKDPKNTLLSVQNQPEVLATLNEFCQLMGNHFSKLGENDAKAKTRSIGPLKQEALKKHAESGDQLGWNENVCKEEQERVKAILADRDLSSILMDPDMQMIIKECGEIPGKMHYFMKSEVHGTKLKKLIRAGLLKVGH